MTDRLIQTFWFPMPQPKDESGLPKETENRSASGPPLPEYYQGDQAPDSTDENLMLKVQSGNSQALQQLIQRYAQALLTFLTRMLGNRDDADDLLQESLMSLWNRRATYKYPRPFRPWIFTIAANKGRELLRNKTRQLIRPSGEKAMTEVLHQHAFKQGAINQRAYASPLEQVLQQETNQAVLAATQCLPPQQRAVLSLRIWNELSYAEIAEVLQSTESTVRSHLFHALKNLRLSLAGAGSHE